MQIVTMINNVKTVAIAAGGSIMVIVAIGLIVWAFAGSGGQISKVIGAGVSALVAFLLFYAIPGFSSAAKKDAPTITGGGTYGLMISTHAATGSAVIGLPAGVVLR